MSAEDLAVERYTAFMPRAAFEALSSADLAFTSELLERSEGVALMRASSKEFFEALANGFEDRVGLAWLHLPTAMKYTIFEHGPADLVLQLLHWDATHLDTVHSRHMQGTPEELFFDQRLASFCAALHNEKIPVEEIQAMLAALQHSYVQIHGPEEEWAGLLSHVLWDRWDVLAIAQPTLALLHSYFKKITGAEAEVIRFSPESIAEARRELEGEDAD